MVASLALESPLTVLCVDDESSVLRGLERTLRRKRYRVLTAPGAGPALEILGRDQVDVLIADIDMPEMSGLELVQIARRDHPETVRLLLTAQSSFETVLAAVNDGAVAKYLTKPWNDEVLHDTLSGVDAERGARREAAERRRVREGHLHLIARHAAMFPGLDRLAPGVHAIDVEALLRAGLATERPELRGLLP